MLKKDKLLDVCRAQSQVGSSSISGEVQETFVIVQQNNKEGNSQRGSSGNKKRGSRR